MNLFQKYLPKKLENIFGHNILIKELLKRTSENNFPNNIYISGISGVGKSAIAKIIAKTILCLTPLRGNQPCCTCSSCTSIQEEKSLLNFSNYNCAVVGKEEIENIIDNSTKRVSFCENKNKVILLEEWQSLKSAVAEKCLLKSLEKPVKNLFWMITTMEDSETNSAIRNRCVPFFLKPLNKQEVNSCLTMICKEENIILDTPEKIKVVEVVADYSKGSVRTAISLLERVIYSELWEESLLFKELNLLSNESIQVILYQLCIGDMKVFQTKFDDNLLKELNWRLLLAYKKLSGAELNRWQLSQVQFSDDVSLSVVENLIRAVREILRFPYNNAFIIESYLIEAMNEKTNSQN